MKHFRQLGTLLLLLVTCVAPVMACVAPDVQMTAEERACCRMMNAQCEQTGMPASHGCCQKTTQSVHDNALKTDAFSFHPIAIVTAKLFSAESLYPELVRTGWLNRPEYSPPKSPPTTIFVLRI